MPAAPRHNLALETSSRHGSVTLGDGDALLATRQLSQRQRHNIELMTTIDALFREHGLKPTDLAELYVSIGPGSFSGLRVGIATAKALADALGCRLVAVPTVEAMVRNVPPQVGVTLAACANQKGPTLYAGLFAAVDGAWQGIEPPALTTLPQLLARDLGPLWVLGDPLPDDPAVDTWPSHATRLAGDLAQPRSEAVWHVGRALAQRRAYTDALSLAPLYVRPPQVTVKNTF